MKGVIISICIAAVIVAGSIAYTSHIENVSDELGEISRQITERLESEDYVGAAEKAAQLDEYLSKERTVLAMTGNHEELDKIEMNISEMTEYIDGGQRTDALSRCKVLNFLFEHLPKNYEMRWENIL
ncbi:MAG: DUF4363 family protein [Oscillospiraceae bacterium]|nr:DUF4363 family protein [Oscillospiraceae bacterium]